MIDMRAQCWNLEGPLRPIKFLTKFMKNFQSWKFHVKSNEFEEKLFRVKSNAQQIFSKEQIFLKEQIFSMEHIFLKEQIFLRFFMTRGWHSIVEIASRIN